MGEKLAVLTKEFFSCLRCWNYQKIRKLCNKHVLWKVYTIPPIGGAYKGIEEVITLLQKLEHEIPNGLNFKLQKLVIQEPYAAVDWVDYGIRKDGHPYENRGMSFIKYDAKGKIVEVSEMVDASVLGSVFQ